MVTLATAKQAAVILVIWAKNKEVMIHVIIRNVQNNLQKKNLS